MKYLLLFCMTVSVYSILCNEDKKFQLSNSVSKKGKRGGVIQQGIIQWNDRSFKLQKTKKKWYWKMNEWMNVHNIFPFLTMCMLVHKCILQSCHYTDCLLFAHGGYMPLGELLAQTSFPIFVCLIWNECFWLVLLPPSFHPTCIYISRNLTNKKRSSRQKITFHGQGCKLRAMHSALQLFPVPLAEETALCIT